MAKQPIRDPGVSKKSTIDAHVPTAFAKRALFYLIFAGEFICNRNYRIDRNFVDMFLLMYVRKGCLRCSFEGNNRLVGPGEIILIDCKSPHVYGSDSDHTEFQWFHFDGNGCQAYYDRIKEQDLLLTRQPSDATTIHINSILQMMRKPFIKEQTASILIHSILRNISEQDDNPEALDDAISWAVEHLYNHYAEPISIDDIAEMANLSKYHFIRTFKRNTGSTPHELLIHIRIKRAMELLTGMEETIESISAQCGFNSPSHFARCFKNVMGTTPGEFRRLHRLSMGGGW